MVLRPRRYHKISLKKKTRKLSGFAPQMFSPREKLQNCIWIFKLGDADDHPSIPHAHAQEVGYRLNVWTGEIYPAGNEREKILGRLTTKELQKLHNDRGFLKFAKRQIEWYRTEHPHIRFFVPEWFELTYMKMCKSDIGKENNMDKYVFIGKAYIQNEIRES